MKCAEVRELIGAYLDSELDTRSTNLVRQHLEQCAECAGLGEMEASFNAALTGALRQPAHTPALWAAEEQFVRHALSGSKPAARPGSALGEKATSWRRSWAELFWPGPRYYGALAAVWMVLLVTRPSVEGGHEARQPGTSTPRLSPTSRLVLLEQRRELRELLTAPEVTRPVRASEGQAPRSQGGTRERGRVSRGAEASCG
jgi:anti-sigma factor RsiW